jgi:hypothetical protein
MSASFYWSWAISALVIGGIGLLLGRQVRSVGGGWLGILIDNRGRYSLTHLQVVLWTLVVLSLVSGMFWGRLLEGVEDPLGFSVSAEVLGLLGISLGSGLASAVVKSQKDEMVPERIAAGTPRFSQIFMIEEGDYADAVVDISKFQNFVITLILVVAFVAQAIDLIDAAEDAAAVALPTFSPTFLTLLGISHAAYVGGKIPGRDGIPAGLSVEDRRDAIATARAAEGASVSR